jgi:hypothetical protein
VHDKNAGGANGGEHRGDQGLAGDALQHRAGAQQPATGQSGAGDGAAGGHAENRLSERDRRHHRQDHRDPSTL